MSYHNTKTPKAERDTFRTPLPIFRWLNNAYQFGYDLAASEHNALAPLASDDAFKIRWAGHARAFGWRPFGFCNPPYSDIEPWIDRAIEEARDGFTTVMLIPTPNGESYYTKALFCAKSITQISGRLAFIGADGKPKSGNNRGSCVIEFGPLLGIGSPSQHIAHRSDIYEAWDDGKGLAGHYDGGRIVVDGHQPQALTVKQIEGAV